MASRAPGKLGAAERGTMCEEANAYKLYACFNWRTTPVTHAFLNALILWFLRLSI